MVLLRCGRSGEPVYEDGWRLGRVAGSTKEASRSRRPPRPPDGVDETTHSGGEFDEKVRGELEVRVNTPRSGSATVSEKQLKTFALAVLSNPERSLYMNFALEVREQGSGA